MEKIISLLNNQEAQALFGTCDKNIRAIEKQFSIKISTRGGELKLNGEAKNMQKAVVVVNSLLDSIRKGRGGGVRDSSSL